MMTPFPRETALANRVPRTLVLSAKVARPSLQTSFSRAPGCVDTPPDPIATTVPDTTLTPAPTLAELALSRTGPMTESPLGAASVTVVGATTAAVAAAPPPVTAAIRTEVVRLSPVEHAAVADRSKTIFFTNPVLSLDMLSLSRLLRVVRRSRSQLSPVLERGSPPFVNPTGARFRSSPLSGKARLEPGT